ncbi:MAG: hypothetical protein L3I99_01895 [Sulfurimonas sp.]|nr:hypothetical protein [Sulfurimonas sp.]
MEILIFGLIAAFNMLIIIIKLRMNRYADAGLDVSIFIILNYIASGTLTGMMIATIASLVVSIFLYFSPP